MRYRLAIPLALLTGCGGTPTSDVFNTGPAHYESIDFDPPTAKTKVFIKRGYSCNYSSKPAEAGALVALLAPALVNKAVNYAFDKAKEYKTYLNSDVTLKGSAFLFSEDRPAAWPSPETAQLIQDTKEEYVNEKIGETTQIYLDSNRKHTKTDKALAELISAKRKKFEEDFDKSFAPELKISQDDLCVLVVAGKYNSSENDQSLNSFITHGQAAREKLMGYTSYTPTLAKKHSDYPFKGMLGDPSLVYEMHIIVTTSSTKNIYTIVPQNLFYPNALHKGSNDRSEKKLTITTTLGDHAHPIVMQHMTAGANRNVFQVADQWVQFTAPTNEAYDRISVAISEGPDTSIVPDLLDAVETSRDQAVKMADKKVKKELEIEDEAKK